MPVDQAELQQAMARIATSGGGGGDGSGAGAAPIAGIKGLADELWLLLGDAAGFAKHQRLMGAAPPAASPVDLTMLRTALDRLNAIRAELAHPDFMADSLLHPKPPVVWGLAVDPLVLALRGYTELRDMAPTVPYFSYFSKVLRGHLSLSSQNSAISAHSVSFLRSSH
jgi:hypothetical protein